MFDKGISDYIKDVHADLARRDDEIKRLRAQVKLLGEIGDVCVYDTLGVVCDFCRCSRREKST